MDPLSIVGTSAGLIASCYKISTTIYTFATSAAVVDETLTSLQSEVSSLSSVLQSIHTSFADPEVAAAALTAQTGHEGQHWKDVRACMGNCSVTLEKLGTALEDVATGLEAPAADAKGRDKILRKQRKMFRMNLKEEEVDTLRTQILSYTQTMQVSLQMIGLSMQLRNNAASGAVAPRLDDLTTQIHKVLKYVTDQQQQQQQQAQNANDQSQPTTGASTLTVSNVSVMTNLKDCLVSAGKLVSTASTMAGGGGGAAGSTWGGSQFGEPLGDDRQAFIEGWIPEVGGIDEEQVSEDDLSDLEADIIHSLRDKAKDAFRAGDYAQAEDLYGGVLRRCNQDGKNDPTGIDLRDIKIWIARCQVRQRGYGTSMDRSDLEHSMRQIVEDETRPEFAGLRLNALHGIAELLYHEKKLSEAKTMCQDVAKQRRKMFGRRHESFLESMQLLIDICEADGKSVEALEYRLVFFPKPSDQNTGLQVNAGVNGLLAPYPVPSPSPSSKNLNYQKPVTPKSEPSRRADRTDEARVAFKMMEKELDLEMDNSASKNQALLWAATHGYAPLFEQLLGMGASVLDAKDIQGANALHKAAWAGSAEIVELCLHNNIDIEAKDSDQRTALHRAVARNYVDVVEVLFKNRQPPDPNSKDSVGRTALHRAAVNGCYDIAIKLLDAKATINIKDSEEGTPLMLAASQGHTTTAVLLLERGADWRAQNNVGWPALHLAIRGGHTDTAMAMLDAGVDIDYKNAAGWSPLYDAVFKRNVELAEDFIRRGADVNTTDQGGDTPLHLAARNGDEPIVRALILSGKANVNARGGGMGMTPLYCAAMNGHTSVAEYLMDCGADPNIANNNDASPLRVAAANGDESMFELLLNHGAFPNQRDSAGDTPILAAVKAGSTAIAKKLLEINHRELQQGPFMTSVVDPVMRLATSLDNTEICKLAVQYGAKMDVPDQWGMTPMAYAVKMCNAQKVEKLLAMGSNPNHKNKDGHGPVRIAACFGGEKSGEIVHILAKAGANINERDPKLQWTPLIQACQRNCPEVVKALLELGSHQSSGGIAPDGFTALHTAATGGYVEIVRLLLDYGFAVHVNDQSHPYARTPVHWATSEPPNLNITKMFIVSGADMKIKDAYGKSGWNYAKKTFSKKEYAELQQLSNPSTQNAASAPEKINQGKKSFWSRMTNNIEGKKTRNEKTNE